MDKNVLVKIPTETEVKVCLMSFQLSLPGVPHTEVAAARPQSNNESNDFIIDMKSVSSKVMKSTGAYPTRFLDYTGDGVLCESRHVWKSNCDFLS